MELIGLGVLLSPIAVAGLYLATHRVPGPAGNGTLPAAGIMWVAVTLLATLRRAKAARDANDPNKQWAPSLRGLDVTNGIMVLMLAAIVVLGGGVLVLVDLEPSLIPRYASVVGGSLAVGLGIVVAQYRRDGPLLFLYGTVLVGLQALWWPQFDQRTFLTFIGLALALPPFGLGLLRLAAAGTRFSPGEEESLPPEA